MLVPMLFIGNLSHMYICGKTLGSLDFFGPFFIKEKRTTQPKEFGV